MQPSNMNFYYKIKGKFFCGGGEKQTDIQNQF